MRRPYPITGVAICNALGNDAETVANCLFSGQSGLRPSPLATPFATWVGRIDDAALDPNSWTTAVRDGLDVDMDTRQSRIAVATAAQIQPGVDAAIARWGADRIALIIGTSTGGIGRSEDAIGAYFEHGELPANYDILRQHAFYATTEVLAATTGITGPRFVVSTACTSSAKVVASARRLLDAGVVDAALVGGVDSLCKFTLMGFHGLQVLSEDRCRPFSRERAGINIGEGGALLLIEREAAPEDGRPALARIAGVGETNDAHHMTTPHPDSRGAIAAMRQAVGDAGLVPADVGHINAHGTATRINDTNEARAIGEVFGEHMSVASTKAFTGHLLGACGATELIFGVFSIARGEVPASLGSAPLDPEVAVTVEPTARHMPVEFVASNSFAFGGNNICVCLGPPDLTARGRA